MALESKLQELKCFMKANGISDVDLDLFGDEKRTLYLLASGTLKYQYFGAKL